MRLPTEAEIAEINARHLIETPLRPADLLFVFGTRVDVSERVDEACRLWRKGYFRWAIVSGGVTPGSELSECEIIADAMVARGIPSGLILREDRAMNTGENVIFSLPIIDAALGLANIRSVICLGNSWTARRALWHTDAEFSRRMLIEWDKIEPYKAKGFIAEWPAGETRDR